VSFPKPRVRFGQYYCILVIGHILRSKYCANSSESSNIHYVNLKCSSSKMQRKATGWVAMK